MTYTVENLFRTLLTTDCRETALATAKTLWETGKEKTYLEVKAITYEPHYYATSVKVYH